MGETMSRFYSSGDLVLARDLPEHMAFWEQHERWFEALLSARANHHAPDDRVSDGHAADNGELALAKDCVFDWLAHEHAECGLDQVDLQRLVASDLPYVWLNAHFPEGLDPHRTVDALIDWIHWLAACGLFDAEHSARFASAIEATRASFVAWSRVDLAA